MNSFRKLYKALCLCFVSLTVILNISLPVYAGVYTEHSDGGDADTVYVAGNPNAYPLEYYSKEEKAFCGVFPNILNAVSEKTNISFTYISASDKNRQKELSRNNQVEIVTALTTDQNECKVNEMLPILEVSSKGKNKTYCMGFTEIASPELIGKVKNAFSEISEQEKAGYLIASTRNNPEVNRKNRLIKITAFSSAAVFIVICSIIIVIAVK